MRTRLLLFFCFLFSALPKLQAEAVLLLEEPFGSFGSVNPTGHAAVYLRRVCAASPTILRRCEAGESGAVVSRYHKIAGHDWVAVPLIPYLYAVERSDRVPSYADPETIKFVRDTYRRQYLQEIVPNGSLGEEPSGDWIQLIGAAYDRKIYAFGIETTETRDDEFIEKFNSVKNEGRFNLLFRNCADFARDVINFYYPKALRRSFIADVGITTPKQMAKALVHFAKRHPELRFNGFTIPQIPGSLPRSTGVRGVLESLVKSKKYAVPLAVAQLWLPPALAAAYLSTGRFNASRSASTVFHPAEVERRAMLALEVNSGQQPMNLALAAMASEDSSTVLNLN